MKKMYSTIFAILATGLTVVSYGQSQRLVMVDHFTQASCGPCASQNPQMETTLNSTPNVIAVKHQVSWPGSDPMNTHYPAGPEDRRNYYGITGVPNTCLDGAGPGAPNTIVTSATINARAAVPSPFTLDVSHVVTGGDINVTVDATCSQAVSGTDMRVFMAVVEREVLFTSAPGSNGETEFYNVLKQYLGGTSGTSITGSWAVNDNATYNDSWTYTNVYDENQLSVVAWIQDLTTGEIHQAGYSAPVAQYSLNAMAFAVADVPKEVCDGNVAPTVTIRNAGGTDLTSLTINYDVDGTAATPYNWTGNLSFLESDVVTLPNLAFTAGATNNLTVTVSAPNGGADEFAGDDAVTASFDEAGLGDENVTLTVTPDNYGSETTWTVKNSGGTTLYSGGPYTDGDNTPVVVPMTFAADDCYEFEIFDTFGDGICCAWGNGGFDFVSGGSSILTGGEFTDEETRLFRIAVAGLDEQNLVSLFNVYPNPTADVANVVMNLNAAADVALEVYSTTGQLVYSSNEGELAAGDHTFSIDFNSLDAGIYMVEVVAGGNKVSKRVTNMK